ncbi:RNA polymerase sigma factor SigZ [Aquibacillus halophilus]|uniref:RNA polymerase sigma factor SigZ n=1 Tax=Aquibacillus halophilus TaxID=930132 RepID=A0A6A8DTD9_9BACI|nr:RNA polymerase sigma factor SigZ [Aquibacillus halophilus]MRH44492.1 RNA polymerase sigma factor SigZ [Aquibacillus halophilus]
MEMTMILEQFKYSLENFIKGKVSNSEDVADLLQDVFLKIHSKLGELKDEEKLQPWVYQIARNTITDYYRKKSKDITKNPKFIIESSLIEQDQQNVNENMNEIVSSWLRELMDILPDKYREALLLSELGQLTQKDLAERLQISVPGAKSRVQRARKLLKEALLDCCHLEIDSSGNVIDYWVRQESCSCRDTG